MGERVVEVWGGAGGRTVSGSEQRPVPVPRDGGNGTRQANKVRETHDLARQGTPVVGVVVSRAIHLGHGRLWGRGPTAGGPLDGAG